MLKGLRKKETYDELINELGDEPISKFPDRRATQLENSNYLSQLALGFQEVIQQNNRVIEEKTKQLLLQEAAGTSESSMSFKSALQPAPARFDIHTPRDIAPRRDFQEYQDEMETQQQIEEDHARREQSRRQHNTLDMFGSMMDTAFNAAHGIASYITRDPEVDEPTHYAWGGTQSASSSSSAPAPVREMVKDYEKKIKKQRKPGKSSSKASDADVEIQGANLNKSPDISYWKQQSANELRNQLQLRNVPRDSRWFKKPDLIKLVQQLIKDKKW